jgi:hypothetical protein
VDRAGAARAAGRVSLHERAAVRAAAVRAVAVRLSPSATASAVCCADPIGRTRPALRSPDVPSTLHRIRSTDGVTLSAASIGTGPRAVVLLHQSDGDACGWWSFGARWLAAQGYRVLIVELRCFGESTCPGPQQSRRTAG